LTLGISVITFLILIFRDGLGYLQSVIAITARELLLIVISGAIWGYVSVALRRYSLLWIVGVTICALLGMGTFGVWATKLVELNWSLLFFVAFFQQAINSGISLVVLEFRHRKNEGEISD